MWMADKCEIGKQTYTTPRHMPHYDAHVSDESYNKVSQKKNAAFH